MEDIRRRLQSVPSWGDLLVVFVLSMFMLCLLKMLKRFSDAYSKRMAERIEAALKLRKHSGDKFRAKNGYSWDYVMVK